MDINASDPDIDTIFNRINHLDWNLQPDFQRGEVWSVAKKQRLIDSVLRGWHIPPIHLIEETGSKAEVVLDGQQRLTAIRDFRLGRIAVNGTFSPHDDAISKLDGLTYDQLPDGVKRAFGRQSIRVLTIANYQPEEPGELFFRLNQPTNLTTAEQRNAFFGPVRSQVKELVEALDKVQVDEAFLGFSNSRMAYDDVIARVATTLQYGSLKTKVTASSVSEMYRRPEGLSWEVMSALNGAVMILGRIRALFSDYRTRPEVRFNKATLHSWLLMLISVKGDIRSQDEVTLAQFVLDFEVARMSVKPGGSSLEKYSLRNLNVFTSDSDATHLRNLLSVYNDRAASRVADVNSVIVRDAVLWIFAANAAVTPPLDDRKIAVARDLSSNFLSLANLCSEEEALITTLANANWGELL